jgi:hypothetical protein
MKYVSTDVTPPQL